MKRTSLLVLCRLVLCLLMLPVGRAAAANGDVESKLMGDLPAVLERSAADELVPVYFVLTDQLEGRALAAAAAAAAGTVGSGSDRARIVGALKVHAGRTQAGLVALLRSAEARGRAGRIQPLWIGNVIAADLVPAEVRALAARPEVLRVNWSPERDVWLGPRMTPADPHDPAPLAGPDGPDGPSGLNGPNGPIGASNAPQEIECGVDRMQAPRVWNELGVTGEGAVVAVIDSGLCWTHSDIAQQVWVNPGEDIDHDGEVMDPSDMNGIDDDGNGRVDDLIGWDFQDNDNQPEGRSQHGSHCAGTVAGDGTAGTQAGMAPDAKIMVLSIGGGSTDEPRVWSAMQYAAENGADVISMSYGWQHYVNPDRATWRTACDNTIDAGTAMVLSAGNTGGGAAPDNVSTPGDVPRVITVGATDCADVIAGFSSRGPVTWEDVPPFNDYPYPPGLVKPDVSAPGVDTKSHDLCSGYLLLSGTSMAAPHVAGTLALMKSSNPALTHDDMKQILEATAVDLGEPGKDNAYGAGRVDAYQAVLRTATADGRVAIRGSVVSCAGGILGVTVADSDLRGTGSVVVRLTSDTETAGEPLTLIETHPGSGAFEGEMVTAPGAAAADGLLQSGDGDTIRATYVDANDGKGGTNVTKTDTVLTDCVAPVIDDVRAEQVGPTTARIRWSTGEASDSLVEYGTTTALGQTMLQQNLTAAHDVGLSGLAPCTVYYYRVRSKDGAGNSTASDKGGALYHFETLVDLGAGAQACHAGSVTLDKGVYSCSMLATIEVSDVDLNLDAAVVDTATLLVTSTTETQPETVVVTETGPNTSRFRGTISTAGGSPAPNGTIETRHGDTLTASYYDADDGAGFFNVAFDMAVLDCSGPRISDLRVESITDQRLTFRFTTDEPADTVIEYGLTPALGETYGDAARVTDHTAMLNQFADCSRLYFRVRATDAYGYATVTAGAGAPFAASLGLVPGLYYRETFEAGAAGWTLQGEWQTGTPQGKGGSSGLKDPTAAYNNDGVLGHDLTGLGAFPGDYEPGRLELARSPSLNATTWRRTKLIYYRRLVAGSGDNASAALRVGSSVSLYSSNNQAVTDTTYVIQSFDVASRVDGVANVQLEFSQQSSASGNYSGWNVDDVIFKDGALPDYGPCGQCAAKPSFAGATTAVDTNQCATAGVTISWERAVAWGSGGEGSYTLWRGTSPGFTPTDGNRVATGVTALAYTDATAPPNTPVWYLVRAENNETCGSGPHRGVLDDNTVYVGVTNSTAQPVPPVVAGLDVDAVAKTQLRLSWPAVPDAARYRIYRSGSPVPASFAALAETAALFYDDVGEAAAWENRFYLVRAVNGCGTEGP